MSYIWTFALLLISSVVLAQEMASEERWMEPDRPGMSTGTGSANMKQRQNYLSSLNETQIILAKH